MDTIHNGDIELRVQIAGEGPDVLLIHGWPDSHKLWRHQVSALVDAGYRVIAPDLRGFGESSRPADIAAYEAPLILSDLGAILNHYGVERTHVVGHDWGALFAWAVAGFMPQLTKSLSALSVGHPAAFFNGGIAQREKSWYMYLFMYEGLAEQTLMADDWKFAREFTNDHPEFENWRADLERDGALSASLNVYRANVDPRKPRVEVPRCSAPTMGLWSTQDAYLIESQMTASKDFVDNRFRYERIEGASHWMQVDQPERVNALLLDFIGSVENA